MSKELKQRNTIEDVGSEPQKVGLTRRLLLRDAALGAAALSASLLGASAPAAMAEPAGRRGLHAQTEDAALSAQSQADSGQSQMLLNDSWRFTKGDQPDSPIRLAYEAPDWVDGAAVTPAVTALKPWLLPTSNAFIADPSKRHARPEGPFPDVAYAQPDFDDSSWEAVRVPHDWAIAGPFDPDGNGEMGRLPTAGVGWYRRKLEIRPEDADKSIFLDVDGAMSYAAVWLNGQMVGGWPYGYASWRLNLTPYVQPGATNVLAIRLDNPPGSSRWYPGAGIYRNVHLVKTAPVHVGHWGTFITTSDVSKAAATVHLKSTVDNDSAHDTVVTVASDIFSLDSSGHRGSHPVALIKTQTFTVPAGGSADTEGSTTVPTPRLWGPAPQQPNRYVAVTTVSLGEDPADIYETPFGIRKIEFSPDAGVIVNDQHVPLRGVCLHHDQGALGAAFHQRALQRQLEMLAEMGCNAIRTSHNPHAPELMELADQMGLLVLDEMFDCWQIKKTPNDYHLLFDDWHEQDMRAQMRRDRNSPSVFGWSIGNEVGEQWTGEDGAALARSLSAISQSEDSTRPTTMALNFAPPTSPLPAAVDMIGLNYQGVGVRQFPGTYSAFHEAFPDKMIFSTESSASISSRGDYMFPVAPSNDVEADAEHGEDTITHQVSAYEIYRVPFGASPDRVFGVEDTHPFSGGEFVWTGWDYLGEPTPFDSSRSSYYGIIDLAGLKKDRYYLYQAHWRPELPIAHILPHWTWPDRVGQVTPVHVFTSGDEAELFLNGKSLGRKAKGQLMYRLRWDDVVYAPGMLEVVAYKNGKPWATGQMKTAGAATSLKLEADRPKLRADGRDLSYVTITVADAHGITAPRANNVVHVDVKGPGELVGMDNGDATDLQSFPLPYRQAFFGQCVAIVRGIPGRTGRITVTATSPGLSQGTVSTEAGG